MKLRHLCTYIAATLQLEKGAVNEMMRDAATIELGPGTEATGHADTAAAPHPGAPAPRGAGRPGVARIPAAVLPDAPTPIRVGQAVPLPDGVQTVPMDKIGKMFGGALGGLS